jgi:hypothetical protein
MGGQDMGKGRARIPETIRDTDARGFAGRSGSGETVPIASRPEEGS